MTRVFCHLLLIAGLTASTQIGGVVWAFALNFQRKIRVFILAYTVLTIATIWVAPLFGRVALSCFEGGPLQVQNILYCALNRNYMDPELAQVLAETADEMNERYPDTVTLVLDANFPFWDGFPLLPHLSHNDGDKVDLAFYYRDEKGYLKSATRSPIGYFAFEHGQTECTPKWTSLRWNLEILQPFWHRYTLDKTRNKALLQILSNDIRIGKILVEPHLARSLNTTHPKIRFQGCHAARHDDHIHIQLR